MAAELSSSRRTAGTAIVLLAGYVVIAGCIGWSLTDDVKKYAIFWGCIGVFFALLPGWRIAGFALYAAAIITADIIFVSLLDDFFDHHFYLVTFLWAVVIVTCMKAMLYAYRYSGDSRLHFFDVFYKIDLAIILILVVLFRSLLPRSKADLHIEHYRGVVFMSISIALLLYTLWRLKRHAYELWVSSWIRIMYKIRAKGPGFNAFPIDGPVLVIANHACWWDPLFVAGILPRPITPMMTASFHDIWHLKPFMKYVINAIRVPEKPVRHEAPELKEAVAALDRGECVVIFPEGLLRRKEEVPLHRFGRGVYQILKDRPNTPVVSCWIEGAWGSWCSWKGGPPTKNKKFDLRRRIEIGVSLPEPVPAEALENHFAARVFLMNRVSAARKHLGLEPLPEFPTPKPGEPDEAHS
jgi:1-acyl-sn-glycerol-3-phosphate acyltransferase